jgi:hypothetical protein
MSRAGALLLACLLVASSALGVAAQEPPQDGQPRSGTVVEFHGWSPDSQYVAYTRSRRAATRPGHGKPRISRRSHHRRVKDGRFQGTGPVAPDQHIPRYAERKGYVVPALERMEVSDTETWFVALEGTYKLQLTVGETLVWELSFEGELIERRSFDTIYVKCIASLYPAPDRRHALLVMHLDRGWNTEAAVYPLTSPDTVRKAWAHLQGDAETP